MLTYTFKLHPTPDQVDKLVALCLYQRDLYNELLGWAKAPWAAAQVEAKKSMPERPDGEASKVWADELFKRTKALKPESRLSTFPLNRHLKELRATSSFRPYRIAIQRSASEEIAGAVKAMRGGNRMPGRRDECRSFADTDPNGRSPLVGEDRHRFALVNTGLDDLRIKCTVHRDPIGTVRKWSVKAERWPGYDKSGRRCNGDNGRWMLCLTTDANVKQVAPMSQDIVGVDPGVRTLLTCSDGTTVENPAHGMKAAEHLDALQAERDAMRNQRRGTSKRRLGQLFARVSAKVARQRKHTIMTAAHFLARRYAVVCIEDSSGDIGRSKDKTGTRLHRATRDAAWGGITTRLEQIAEGRVRRVNPAYTTQDCSVCGHRDGPQGCNKTFTCHACGATMGRDLNAARNILKRGKEVTP